MSNPSCIEGVSVLGTLSNREGYRAWGVQKSSPKRDYFKYPNRVLASASNEGHRWGVVFSPANKQNEALVVQRSPTNFQELVFDVAERYQPFVTGHFLESLPQAVIKTHINYEPLEVWHTAFTGLSAHLAEFSGRVAHVDGDKVIIAFQVDGDIEEREFARDELTVDEAMLKVGALVVATTMLRFLPLARKSTPQEKLLARRKVRQAEVEWRKIDEQQVPRVPPIGS